MEPDRRGAELLFHVLTEREEKAGIAITAREAFSKAQHVRMDVCKVAPKPHGFDGAPRRPSCHIVFRWIRLSIPSKNDMPRRGFMTTQHSTIGRVARRPAVFAVLVLVTGVITGVALYSRAGFFGLTRRVVVAQSPNGYGIPLDHPAFTQMTRPGVIASAHSLAFIDGSPDTGQYLWQALTTFPGFVVTVGAFFLLWRLLWRARGGVYIAQVARQVRFLGWWLLVGGLLAPQLENFAMMRLLDTMAVGEASYRLGEIPLVVSLVALGLLALASILRDGVRMRDDLEGTV
ncbi:hypothetical protein [Microtetraspora malaysiensis]|uniref:hypothetical protein n=1 Tax=Microtetraspora malaysiensis TaxID=161358 RepID=UPI003D8D022B